MRQHVFVGLVLALGYMGLCSFGYIEKYFGATTSYEEGTSAMPLPGGGYLVSGAYNSNGNPTNWKSYLLMLNDQGDTVWTQKNLSASGKVKPTIDNKFIYIGGNNAGQAYDTIYITKADLTGNVEWRKQLFFGVCHNTVSDILTLADGSYIVTGFFAARSCTNPTYDSFILKMDANGNVTWQKFITGTMNQEMNVLKQLPDGNFAAFGWTNSNNETNNADYLLVKFDANGNILWRQTYGDANDNYGYGLEVLADGSFMMLGYTANMELIKADETGLALWKKTFGTACGGSNFKVGRTTDGGLALLGSENTGGQCTSVFMKTDYDGNIIWKKNWNARIREFREKTDGSFILTGYANYLPDVAVILFDSTRIAGAPAPVLIISNPNLKPIDVAKPAEADTTATGIDYNKTGMGELKVYPNPADEQLNFVFDNPNSVAYRLEIYSVNGQMVRDEHGLTTGNIILKREDWISGMYTYRLTGEGRTFTGKFIFQ